MVPSPRRYLLCYHRRLSTRDVRLFGQRLFLLQRLVQVFVKIATWGGVVFALIEYWRMYTELEQVTRANKEEIV